MIPWKIWRIKWFQSKFKWRETWGKALPVELPSSEGLRVQFVDFSFLYNFEATLPLLIFNLSELLNVITAAYSHFVSGRSWSNGSNERSMIMFYSEYISFKENKWLKELKCFGGQLSWRSTDLERPWYLSKLRNVSVRSASFGIFVCLEAALDGGAGIVS